MTGEDNDSNKRKHTKEGVNGVDDAHKDGPSRKKHGCDLEKQCGNIMKSIKYPSSPDIQIIGAVSAQELSTMYNIHPKRRNLMMEITDQQQTQNQPQGAASLLLLHGSWNKLDSNNSINTCHTYLSNLLEKSILKGNEQSQIFHKNSQAASRVALQVISVQVDQDEDTLDICIADSNSTDTNMDMEQSSSNYLKLKAPVELPALMLIYSTSSSSSLPKNINSSHDQPSASYLKHDLQIKSTSLLSCIRTWQVNSNTTPKAQIFNKFENIMKQSLIKGLTKVQQHHHKYYHQQQDTICSNKRILSSNQSDSINFPENHNKQDCQALRLFIGGDRSQVGKSSICLGLLGTLIHKMNYAPSDLAYIKPATQCEETQLVSTYCKSVGIDACPVGPVVYYKGFTRAFLNGQTDTSNVLLKRIQDAVDKISIGKKVVIIDGVGYPAVGSITGTDNGSVARVCGYPSSSSELPDADDIDRTTPRRRRSLGVIIVGKSGVGDAIDSYNLNSSYFEGKGVIVMGSIFNRLSTQGYYALENCKNAVTSYFDQYKSSITSSTTQEAFGFVPECKELAQAAKAWSMENVTTFIDIFGKHVNISEIIKKAQYLRNSSYESSSISTCDINMESKNEAKKVKLSQDIVYPTKETHQTISREQIEKMALNQGAASSA